MFLFYYGFSAITYNVFTTQGKAAAAQPIELPFRQRQEALYNQATAPLKQIAMLAFMMYMSGNTLNIFPIMMTMSGIYQPLSAILKSKSVFPADPDGKLNTALPRLLYCAVQSLGLLIALYKIHAMGLLPTNLADWVAAIRVPEVEEKSVTSLLHALT